MAHKSEGNSSQANNSYNGKRNYRDNHGRGNRDNSYRGRNNNSYNNDRNDRSYNRNNKPKLGHMKIKIEETVDDIKADIKRIEKEIRLMISEIKNIRL